MPREMSDISSLASPKDLGSFEAKTAAERVTALSRSLLALFNIAIGLAAIAWGIATYQTFWRELAIGPTAAAIVNRAGFKAGALTPLIPAVERIEQASYCHPRALQDAAIIRLRLAEDAIDTAERDALDGRLGTLDRDIRHSLACAPTDAFLWMVLAWLDGVREGFRNEQFTYLRLSYRLGPNEGWIAARRNRFALATFTRLPTDLADAAVHEFARMVDSWVYWDAIAIFTGPGWPIREQLLASLKEVGQRQREAFYTQLYTEGYKIAVPGVAPRDPRPWF
jgi:hypothetical protein